MKPPSSKSLQTQINKWNRKHAVGAAVIVTKDDGSELETITESAACILGGHSAVIFVKGISGAYALHRVRPHSAAPSKVATLPPLVVKVRFASDTYIARISPCHQIGPMAVQASCTSGPVFAVRKCVAKALKCDIKRVQIFADIECTYKQHGSYRAWLSAE